MIAPHELNCNPESTPTPWTLDTAALVAAVQELTQRCDTVLAVKGTDATPAVAQDLCNLAAEVAGLSWQLAYAVTANRLLFGLAGRLWHRAEAYAEVFGTIHPEDDRNSFDHTIEVGANAFLTEAERAVYGSMTEEDIPF